MGYKRIGHFLLLKFGWEGVGLGDLGQKVRAMGFKYLGWTQKSCGVE